MKKKILKLKPKFIVLGGSLCSFLYPVKEVKSICQKVGTKIVYDAAHVFGLIFSGFFQNPLKEGADIITASTHKTFPSPQGGIILGNVEEEFQKKIQNKIFPGVLSNHHLHRIPTLYLTLKRNAKIREKFGVLGKEKGFTQSHQISIDVSKFDMGPLAQIKKIPALIC